MIKKLDVIYNQIVYNIICKFLYVNKKKEEETINLR